MITGYAVCSDELDVIYVGGGTVAATGAQVVEDTGCPVGQPNAIGGGQVNSAPFGNYRLTSDFPFIGVNPDHWSVTAENEGPPTGFTVWADCVADL